MSGGQRLKALKNGDFFNLVFLISYLTDSVGLNMELANRSWFFWADRTR